MSRIKSFLDNPKYFITSPASKGILDWVPDDIYAKALYRLSTGRKCNLRHPVGYNEKLQWLKLHDRKPEYASMVDKYDVRSYIAETIGEQYLIPCLGVYDSVDDIDYDSLPDQFVLKCTHDSGSVEICTDKASFDFNGACERLRAGCKRNYYSTYREWPYKTIKPRIIAEKYMIDDVSADLQDYKIMCFMGKAEIIELHENRFVEGKSHTQTFYDRDWNVLDLSQPGWIISDAPSPRPTELDELLRLSEILAKDMYHIRADWYVANGQIYFGEITFYDGSGFVPFDTMEMEKFLGDKIKLPVD